MEIYPSKVNFPLKIQMQISPSEEYLSTENPVPRIPIWSIEPDVDCRL